MHPAFAPILGQAPAIEFLSRALAADRLPHGLIFAGPVGVGRATTARALATIFLADRPDAPESVAVSRILVEAGTHPNFHVVTKEQVRELQGKSQNKAIELSVDVIRERIIKPAARTTRLSGGGKVFLVEEAEAMNAQAQNALLKTLEEPSGRTLIVLLSDQPHALLATIRSRAQTVRFLPLATADALAILARRGVDGAPAANAVRLAEGSPGLALRWHADGVTTHAATLARLLDQPDPQRGPADLAAFFKAASDEYAKRQLDRDPAGSEDGFRRAGIGVFLRLAGDHLRARLATLDATDARPLDRTCDGVDAIRRAEAYVDGNVNVALVLQQVGAELAR